MAENLNNTSGGTSGVQRLSRITVGVAGHSTQSRSIFPDITTNISGVCEQYDSRLDDPRYYAGDTAS